MELQAGLGMREVEADDGLLEMELQHDSQCGIWSQWGKEANQISGTSNTLNK